VLAEVGQPALDLVEHRAVERAIVHHVDRQSQPDFSLLRERL
jgi:hypothetical protein